MGRLPILRVKSPLAALRGSRGAEAAVTAEGFGLIIRTGKASGGGDVLHVHLGGGKQAVDAVKAALQDVVGGGLADGGSEMPGEMARPIPATAARRSMRRGRARWSAICAVTRAEGCAVSALRCAKATSCRVVIVA